jgi:hypothetical protein
MEFVHIPRVMMGKIVSEVVDKVDSPVLAVDRQDDNDDDGIDDYVDDDDGRRGLRA